MKKSFGIALLLTLCCANAFAHSGRTDSKGGHNCSQKSIDKGLCTGYHYHSGKAYSNATIGHEGHADALVPHHHKSSEETVLAKTDEAKAT
jgi:hypothetical protein